MTDNIILQHIPKDRYISLSELYDLVHPEDIPYRYLDKKRRIDAFRKRVYALQKDTKLDIVKPSKGGCTFLKVAE